MQKFARDSAAIARLSPEQHRVTQFCGTDMPGKGYWAYSNQVGGKP